MAFLSSNLRIKLSLILLCVVLSNCGSNKKPSAKTTVVNSKKVDTSTSQSESFDAFFKKFSSDSVFQLTRVKFPLKITTESEDGDSTRFLRKVEWRYVSFGNGKTPDNIVKKKKIKDGVINVELTVKETGIFVNHYFVIENGKWLLGYVVDDSD